MQPELTDAIHSVSRRYDVLPLHQDRADDVCSSGRLDSPNESVLRDATLEAGVLVHRRVRYAGHILQLRAESADGEVHGEDKVVRALRDERLRDHRRCFHRGRTNRLAALSFGARDTEEDRVGKVQLKSPGPGRGRIDRRQSRLTSFPFSKQRAN